MRILYITKDYGERPSAYTLYFPFLDALRAAGVGFIEVDTLGMYGHSYESGVLSGKSYHMPKVLDPEYINDEFDIIVSCNYFPFMFEDWDKIKIPRVMIQEDLHGPHDAADPYVDLVAQRIGYDAIFAKYYDAFLARHDEYDDVPYYHLPHCMSNKVHKDYGQEKTYEFLMTGTVGGCYVLRDLVLDKLKDKGYFHRIERFNYREMRWPTGVDYCKELNKAWMSLSTTSTYNYTIAKFFEIPACGTALVGNYIPELGRLGFIPGENYIRIENDYDIAGIVEHWLSNKEDLKQIIKAGHDMVNKRHSVEQRVIEFFSYCEDILK